MTAIDDTTDHDQLMQACMDYQRALEHWQGAATQAEAERNELDRQLSDVRGLLADRNGLLRRVCMERAYVIRDEDQLDSLPVGSIIRDNQGAALQCESRPGAWFYTKYLYQAASDEIALPVLVLWNPDWSDQ